LGASDTECNIITLTSDLNTISYTVLVKDTLRDY